MQSRQRPYIYKGVTTVLLLVARRGYLVAKKYLAQSIQATFCFICPLKRVDGENNFGLKFSRTNS